ncbi:MAG: hypothetical protein RMM08_09340 [Armatimonadota bacterium]|nr:DUF2076 domain-containing protein [bacterium]MDW8321556.1 hypothetical protein [Armatimonadota bacterium]
MQQWLNDPKNKPIVIGGAIAVILIIAVAMFLFMGGGGQQPAPSQTATGPTPAGGFSPEGLPEDQPTPGGPSPAGMGGPMGGPMGGATMGGFPGGATQQTAAAPKEGKPPSKYRVDPFKPLSWEADISKPPILSVVTPVRLQPIPTYKPKEEEQEDVLPPQPYRRVAGIMWGESVAAIIETQGDLPRVVKPGDTIDGMRVARIEPNQVVLSTLGKKPQEIAVKLGAPITPVQRAFPGYGGGVPGVPGGVPGAPPGGPGGAGLVEDY